MCVSIINVLFKNVVESHNPDICPWRGGWDGVVEQQCMTRAVALY